MPTGNIINFDEIGLDVLKTDIFVKISNRQNFPKTKLFIQSNEVKRTILYLLLYE